MLTIISMLRITQLLSRSMVAQVMTPSAAERKRIVCLEEPGQTAFLAEGATIRYWVRLARTQFPAMREMIPSLAETMQTALLVAMETTPSPGHWAMTPSPVLQAPTASLEELATTTILYLQLQVRTFMKWSPGARTQSPPSSKTTHSDPSWRF